MVGGLGITCSILQHLASGHRLDVLIALILVPAVSVGYVARTQALTGASQGEPLGGITQAGPNRRCSYV